jgi:hypothetical protein
MSTPDRRNFSPCWPESPQKAVSQVGGCLAHSVAPTWLSLPLAALSGGAPVSRMPWAGRAVSVLPRIRMSALPGMLPRLPSGQFPWQPRGPTAAVPSGGLWGQAMGMMWPSSRVCL